MLQSLRHILTMIRFSHTLFALPFALLAAVMAWYMRGTESVSQAPPAQILAAGFRGPELIGVLLCMVTARSAAMAFNRVADRRIDAGNPRTSQRHLPAGLLSLRSVNLFALANSAAFVLSTLLFLPNWLPIALALPVLAFLLAYSYTKRFTSLAHFWLGASLMLAPVSTWIAIRGQVLLEQPLDILPACTLGAAVLLWVAGFDIIYACQDVDFDRSARLKSIPVRLGVPGALRLAAACHLAMIATLVALPLVGGQLNLGWIYWLGILAVAGLLIWEHLLVRPDDLTRVNIAFFNVNAIVSIGLFLIVTLDLLL